MKLIRVLFWLLPVCFVPAMAQVGLQEGFESGTVIPAGWSVWNASSHPIFDDWNWAVRDTGSTLPGIALNLATSHSGLRAIGVGWQAGFDTNGGPPSIAHTWLISRRVLVSGIAPGDVLRFWATGGGPFLDSLQISVSVTDSTPGTQSNPLGTLVWPVGSSYGQFAQYTYDLSPFFGQTVWIGFRYFLNAETDGYYVHVDDVAVEPVSSVRLLDAGVPDGFALSQNFPNPFNPSTTIQFSIPERTLVSLALYNSLGEEVETLVSRELSPGTYSYDWTASDLSSGVYFYRLSAARHVETRKLVLLR